MTDTNYQDLTLEKGIAFAKADGRQEDAELLQKLDDCVKSIRGEMDRFRSWCDRADALYYTDDIHPTLGADLFMSHPSAITSGRSHVSVNTPAAYVDIPSSLEAYEPVENEVDADNTEEGRHAAAAKERVYSAWKREEEYDLKYHKAMTVKRLYGRTASRVYWDKDLDRPCIEIVEQPRNLYMGWRSDAYDKLEWVAYVQRQDPNSVLSEFGVDIQGRSGGEDTVIPYVQVNPDGGAPARSYLSFGPARIEVWDYWYRRAVRENGKFVRMETVNVVFAGNAVVRGPSVYSEYDGDLPYRALFNTFIPGVPTGRPDLYDMEQLIREKYEQITAAAQMIASAVAGDYWQLVGPEAPTRVPAGLKPVRNGVIAPGAGNRIEVIAPFIAQFQLEQHLGRIDREMAVISGLNDLLLGLAPAQVLSSSKAVNALTANFEARLSMSRRLSYAWRRANHDLLFKVWVKKNATVRSIEKAGGGVLEIKNPSLSPRDEMETMTRALNGVNGKLFAQRTGMGLVGIEDPESEQDMIREERTDATMFPAEVQVMAQLLAALQALNLPQPAGAVGQAQQQLASGQNDLRTALGGATPNNSNSSQLAGDQGVLPPEASTPIANAPFATAQPPQGGQAGGPSPVGLAQTMIQGGKASSRILTQQQLGKRP